MRDLFSPVVSLMNSTSDRPRRSRELIADFSLGEARGWAFKLGSWARTPLAISNAELKRVEVSEINGVESKRSVPYRAWVQGCTFNFTAGTLIHQGNGNPSGTICSVQVIRSISSGRVYGPEGWSYDPGGVVFDLYKPQGHAFKQVKVYECDQLQFIKLLRHGIDYMDEIGIKEAEVINEGCVI